MSPSQNFHSTIIKPTHRICYTSVHYLPNLHAAMATQKILIVGAGVSGSVLAYFLSQHKHSYSDGNGNAHKYSITVIERSRSSQKLGQGLEIEEPALSVIRQMGILDLLEERKTGELGFELCDERGEKYGRLEVGGFSPTGALELMRGDLTEVMYKVADEAENVQYYFETSVRGIQEIGEKVVVEMEDRIAKTTRTEEFDFVVGADGVKSRTRGLVMGEAEELGCFRAVGANVAYFSIPKQPQDWPYSQACQFPGRKIVWTRPISEESKYTSVYFIHVGEGTAELRDANANNDRKAQKEAFAGLYKGLGWEVPRIVSQMLEAENFYSDELAQVKLQSWSKGRVVLVGDSAWAPTPFTGEGNQLAIIGAWVLAQEMGRDRTVGAFQKYEARLRKYVEDAQEIPFGGYAPYIFAPETRSGIVVFRYVGWAFCKTVNFFRWTGLGGLFPEGKAHNEFDLQIEQKETKKAQ